jgi:hypothetical protein
MVRSDTRFGPKAVVDGHDREPAGCITTRNSLNAAVDCSANQSLQGVTCEQLRLPLNLFVGTLYVFALYILSSRNGSSLFLRVL